MESKIVYFDRPGQDNTDEVFRIVNQRAAETGIKTVVVASTRGATAVRAVDALPGLRVVIVSHAYGFREPDTEEFAAEHRTAVEGRGVPIITTAHTFAGINRAVRNSFKTYLTADIMASTLRIFGEGMKVVCEVAMMAADSGLVRCDEDAISVAGTGKGLDTAIVLKPVNSHRFFDLKVREILCKPHF
ncbi:MAG: hypothetical protein HYX91_03465 [Chloroflexi bacterium]|nr:hypothetical protein [Chloroflexota bacterium]